VYRLLFSDSKLRRSSLRRNRKALGLWKRDLGKHFEYVIVIKCCDLGSINLPYDCEDFFNHISRVALWDGILLDVRNLFEHVLEPRPPNVECFAQGLLT